MGLPDETSCRSTAVHPCAVHDRDAAELPTWDMTAFFPVDRQPRAGGGPRVARRRRRPAGARSTTRRACAAPTPPTSPPSTRCWRPRTSCYDELRLLNAYVHAFVTTDARDDPAAGPRVGAAGDDARRSSPLRSRLDAWLGQLRDRRSCSPPARPPPTTRTPCAAPPSPPPHQLSDPEEDLAAELNLSGGSAWNQLHGEVTSRLTADRRRRGAADHRGAQPRLRPATPTCAGAPTTPSWRRGTPSRSPLAACMNGVKGQASTLNRRRGWPDDLAPGAVHQRRRARRCSTPCSAPASTRSRRSAAT